jgi:hypothetical protein
MREFDLRIPVANWIISRGLFPILEVHSLNACDFVGISITAKKIDRMIAVELKLKDVTGVIEQCLHHMTRTSETWAAMPALTHDNELRFSKLGIGLLVVRGQSCDVIHPSPIREGLNFDRWKNLMRRREEYKWRMEHPQMLKFPALKIIYDRNNLQHAGKRP